MSNVISIGKIFSTHGLKGNIKIKSYIQNFKYISDNNLCLDKHGKGIEFDIYSNVQDVYICKFNAIEDIDAAKGLVGNELFANKKDFPKIDDGLYAFDVIGFNVIIEDEMYGEIFDVADYGSGVCYCIKLTPKYAKIFDMKESIILCNDPIVKLVSKNDRKVILHQYNIVDFKTL